MFLADFSSLTFRFGSYLEDGLQASLSLIGFGLSSSAPERYSAKPKEGGRRGPTDPTTRRRSVGSDERACDRDHGARSMDHPDRPGRRPKCKRRMAPRNADHMAAAAAANGRGS